VSWLYGQTWLWYLLAFVVGVLLAWLLLVLPQLRRLRSLDSERSGGVGHGSGPAEPVAAAPAASAGAPGRERAVDDAVTEQIPAVDPALSTLDTSVRGPRLGDPSSTAAAGAAGLGAAGMGAAALAGGRDGSEDEVTREIPRVTDTETTQQIPVVAADDTATQTIDLGKSAETTAVIPVVTDADATTDTGATTDAGAAPAPSAPDGGDTTVVERPAASETVVGESPPGGTPAGDTGVDTTGGATAATSDPTTTAGSPGAGTTAAAAAGGAVAAGGAAVAAGAAGGAAAGGSGSDDAPFGPGSVRPNADGSSPDPAFRIKGNVDTMRYHGSRSPYFDRTPAAVWFRTGADAEAAGFVSWNTRGRRPAVQGLVSTPAATAVGPGVAPASDPTVGPTPSAATDPAPNSAASATDATPSAATDPVPNAAASAPNAAPNATPNAAVDPTPDTAPEAAGEPTPGRFPGSVLPLADGAAPGPEYTIKGNANSMLFHTTASPYYARTKAEVWFVDAASAEAAGFTEWRRRKLG
jgi:hypothetical protein